MKLSKKSLELLNQLNPPLPIDLYRQVQKLENKIKELQHENKEEKKNVKHLAKELNRAGPR